MATHKIEVQLSDNGSPYKGKTFFRLPPPADDDCYHIKFILHPSEYTLQDLALCTNYPIQGEAFKRNVYQDIKFINDHCTDATCTLEVKLSGSFEYFLKVNGAKPEQTGNGYFLIEPKLIINMEGSEPKQVPIEGLVLQTFIPKWLGKLTEWEAHFKAASDAGYNMIHFAPTQRRGASNSPYSIGNQLSFADELFDNGQNMSNQEKGERVADMVNLLERKYGLLSTTDIVLNHTSFDSEWLQDHPEAGYNLVNSPHLRVAFEMDEAILDFSEQLGNYDIPDTVTSEDDITHLLNIFRYHHLQKYRLWEYYVVNVQEAVEEMKRMVQENLNLFIGPFSAMLQTKNVRKLPVDEQVEFLRNEVMYNVGDGARFSKKFHKEKAFQLLGVLFPKNQQENWADYLCSEYTKLINMLNVNYYREYDHDLECAIKNLFNGMKYDRIDSHGPKKGKISRENPFAPHYFTRIPKNERTSVHNPLSLALANNGWIWNGDPMIDFAGPDSKAYLRREVIVWGDCVKLKYGSEKASNPWLWDFMAEYTSILAKTFHGFRIDNCHSTPLHVAEYFLDIARNVRNSLYVLAELFTGNEYTDERFVRRLGINSLVRESMQAWDEKELGRIAWKNGGHPIGSLSIGKTFIQSKDKTYFCPLSSLSMHYSAPAILMDCTHDNETPYQKRTVEDTLSNAAVTSMSCCAIGSTKGYDEFYPKHLDLVHEPKHYGVCANDDSTIVPVKRMLHTLHKKMAIEGYSSIYVDQDNEYVAVHRYHPTRHVGYFVVARCSFSQHHKNAKVHPFKLYETKVNHILSSFIEVKGDADSCKKEPTLCGIKCNIKTFWEKDASPFVKMNHGKDKNGIFTELEILSSFPKGGIAVFETMVEFDHDVIKSLKLGEEYNMKIAMDHLLMSQEGKENRNEVELRDALFELNLDELNVFLYRADEEEKDATGGHGVYYLQGMGSLPYAGLQGFVSLLKPIIQNNDLAHPFCGHLRDEGRKWVTLYVWERLTRYLPLYPKLERVMGWLKFRMSLLEGLPNFLVPVHFMVLVMCAYRHALDASLAKMSPFIQDTRNIRLKLLALTSVQLVGTVSSTGLYPTGRTPCLAAGLPHFATRHMRCWGRDVFISLRGLLILTGLYANAKEHIVAFASTCFRGMIPNLLDSGRRPRFNSRDSQWWFLQAVKEYCKDVPNGKEILQTRFKRRFPVNDKGEDEYCLETDPRAYTRESSLIDVIHEIVNSHARGISFREWNAGPGLDGVMRDEGFQIDIHVDWKTGFIAGGNPWNCGTWMDKMGEVERLGTKGVPATSRNGSPVEIIGLSKSVISWLAEMNEKGLYPHHSVNASCGRDISFREWGDLIQQNFEKHFYIPEDCTLDQEYHIHRPDLVHRRGVYRDVYGCSQEFADYQLRPNFPVAMTAAPELFEPSHALRALEITKDVLVGPLGMKTLDPKDVHYHGDYDNSNDGNDPATAHGFNYHQGPEWVWCTGFFWRAYLHFKKEFGHSPVDKRERTLTLVNELQRQIASHKKALETSMFAGLPELTNSNGQICWHSCTTQAWSGATLIELRWDMQKAASESQS